ncbi:MAG: TetR/AcrR family transcriptional regulator [Promethearchaeota archaeon]|jgi:AcrR family transcriptional regulator
MTPKIKQTRARSEIKKEQQFERILQAGKELFLKRGAEGFSMRNLAEKLDMTKNNLYNYIESKRELWIAIRNRFYVQFKQENIDIIKKHSGSNIELLMKIFKHFIEFAEQDFGVFIMMHALTSAPPSDKVGEIEKKYREFRLLDGTTDLIQNTIDSAEIGAKDPAVVALFLYSLLFGAVYIDMNRREQQTLLENIQLSIGNVSSEKFTDYVLKIIEKLLKEDLL